MIVVLGLVMFVIVAGATYIALLNRILTANIKHAVLQLTPDDDAMATDDTSGDDTSTATASVDGSCGSGALNVLFVGSDSKTNVSNGRSDVIILAHISSDREKVYLVHFPRDMYVEIPGIGKDKINHAYAYGGLQLLLKTLRGLIDIDVDHVAVVGFDGFSAMTDAVGGVDVYAEEASIDEVYNDARTEKWYKTIHVGMNHFNGNEALAFVRERYQLSQGDISRGRRQQAFLKALLLKALSKETLASPVRFLRFVDAATRYLTVDTGFSGNELYSLALSMRKLRSEDIVFITAPFSGSGHTESGGWVEIVDATKMAQLSDALKNDDMGSYPAGEQIP